MILQKPGGRGRHDRQKLKIVVLAGLDVGQLVGWSLDPQNAQAIPPVLTALWRMPPPQWPRPRPPPGRQLHQDDNSTRSLSDRKAKLTMLTVPGCLLGRAGTACRGF